MHPRPGPISVAREIPCRSFPPARSSLPSPSICALHALEQTVPRRFGNITQRLPIPGSKRKSYAFQVEREPFSVAFASDTVVLASTFHYQGRAWYDPPIGPDINGECGTSGERPR